MAPPEFGRNEALLGETLLLGSGFDNSTVCAFLVVPTLPSTQLFASLAERGRAARKRVAIAVRIREVFC